MTKGLQMASFKYLRTFSVIYWDFELTLLLQGKSTIPVQNFHTPITSLPQPWFLLAMRNSWLKALLLVAISLPPDGLAAPCMKSTV